MIETQGPFLLAAVKAYRATSTAALQVLNGTPPWWLEAQVKFEEKARYRLDVEKEKLRVTKLVALPRRAEILRMNGYVYRDERVTFVDACNFTAQNERNVTGIGYVKQSRT